MADDVALARVCEDVRLEGDRIGEALAAVLARLRSQILVASGDVLVATLLRDERVVADVALEAAEGLVVLHVNVRVERLQREELLVALDTRKLLLVVMRRAVRIQCELEGEVLVTDVAEPLTTVVSSLVVSQCIQTDATFTTRWTLVLWCFFVFFIVLGELGYVGIGLATPTARHRRVFDNRFRFGRPARNVHRDDILLRGAAHLVGG